MFVIPSIDIVGGRLARLRGGEVAAVGDDPLDLARRWAAEGAEWLHVVDIDGARTGAPRNLEMIGRITALGVPVQVVAGIRDEATADLFDRAGVARIVVAAGDEELVRRLVRRYGERLAVTVYARAGMASASPWAPSAEITAEAVLRRAAACGVRTAIYADVGVAGSLAGPELSRLAAARSAFDGDLLYSGGIGSLDDIRLLSGSRLVVGAVVGSALDAGRFTLPDAMREALTPDPSAP